MNINLQHSLKIDINLSWQKGLRLPLTLYHFHEFYGCRLPVVSHAVSLYFFLLEHLKNDPKGLKMEFVIEWC